MASDNPTTLGGPDMAVLDRLAAIEAALLRIEPAIEHARWISVAAYKAQMLGNLGPDRIVDFFYKGVYPIRFYVPKAAKDHIQSFQLTEQTFWEADILDRLSRFLRGKSILDIGANVGNHSVYWGLVSGARHVRAFEPIPELFAILTRNISINGLTNVDCMNVALGETAGYGASLSSPSNRMQSEVLVGKGQDKGDGIRIVALDSLGFLDIDFAKIDVEGHTLPLLKGAERTLARCKPALFIELYDHERAQCTAILENLGYGPARDFGDSNFLFAHRERPFTGELPA